MQAHCRPWCCAVLNGVECSGVHIGTPAAAGRTGMQARSAVAASESRLTVNRVKGSFFLSLELSCKGGSKDAGLVLKRTSDRVGALIKCFTTSAIPTSVYTEHER